jgi:hypothetical protein
LGFTVAGLGAAVGLGTGFFGLAIFLLVVISDCLGTSVNGSVIVISVVASTTRPFGRRGSTHLTRLSAPQRARPT